ncbi:hypothetical protein [Stenotrophomonas tuberculopleuritidis]|uniref:hypothetical protein n=1 Tax=Stenotrophomonas tuberculopleuritidis TaxID=3055079 RepID=UPI0026E513E4|nr:hypothetical protein [Stenotrophomonas sp. 704A1]
MESLPAGTYKVPDYDEVGVGIPFYRHYQLQFVVPGAFPVLAFAPGTDVSIAITGATRQGNSTLFTAIINKAQGQRPGTIYVYDVLPPVAAAPLLVNDAQGRPVFSANYRYLKVVPWSDQSNVPGKPYAVLQAALGKMIYEGNTETATGNRYFVMSYVDYVWRNPFNGLLEYGNGVIEMGWDVGFNRGPVASSASNGFLIDLSGI